MNDAAPDPSRPDLNRLRAIVRAYGLSIGLPNASVNAAPQGDGSPYIEFGDAYQFVVEERGIELKRLQTHDLDELLYWLFDGITFSVACDHERQNRRSGEDSRRQLFAGQEALLGQMSAAWRDRKQLEHRHILDRYPFDDDAF